MVACCDSFETLTMIMTHQQPSPDAFWLLANGGSDTGLPFPSTSDSCPVLLCRLRPVGRPLTRSVCLPVPLRVLLLRKDCGVLPRSWSACVRARARARAWERARESEHRRSMTYCKANCSKSWYNTCLLFEVANCQHWNGDVESESFFCRSWFVTGLDV